MASNIVNMTPQADSGLLSAFDNLGKSFQPADLSGVYKTKANTSAIVSSNIKRIQQEDEQEINRKGDMLAKIAEQRMAMVDAGDYDESFTESNETFLEDLGKRLEGTEEGSREERRIIGEANNYFAGVDNFLEASIDAQTTLAGNSENPINFLALERAMPGSSDVLKAIANKTATYGMENGVLYAYSQDPSKRVLTEEEWKYGYDDVSITRSGHDTYQEYLDQDTANRWDPKTANRLYQENIKKEKDLATKMSAVEISEVKSYRRDLKIDNNYAKIIGDSQALGGQGIDYDPSGVETDFTNNIINTKAKYFDAATRKLQGFESSFINAMADNKDLHEKLMELYPKEYNDINKDGIIDELAGENGKKVIDALINDYGGGSGKGPKAFKEYADLQAREEYAKFRSKFDENKATANANSNNTQYKQQLNNKISEINTKGASPEMSMYLGIKGGGNIKFDTKNKKIYYTSFIEAQYTKEEADAAGNPNLEGTQKITQQEISGEKMMSLVFPDKEAVSFRKTFPKLFGIYGTGAPIKY